MGGTRSLAVAGLVVVLAACSQASPSASPAAMPSPDRDAGWRSDIAALVPGMARLHPKLDHGTSRADLDGAATALADLVPATGDDHLMVGVLRIVAMVSAEGCDGHTGAFVWGTGTYPVDSLPLRLWLFPTEQADSLVIVDALPPYEDLVGSTVDTIEGVAELEVRKQLAAVIPRDNDWTVRLLLPRYALIPQVLRGLGIAAAGPVSLGLTTPDGNARTVEIDPIPMADYNAWAGAYGLHLPADPDVPYLSRIDDALWWTSLDKGSTFFVQENRVERTPPAQLEALRAALAASDAREVVLDLRHNFGGEVGGVDPFVRLFTDPAVDRPGRLFVITGRNTFSAASLMVARLVDRTKATIVGEPMGGCPTAYGDAEEFTLPYSGIVVDVPTVLEVGVAADDPRLTIAPGLAAPLSASAWAAGTDPALAAIAASTR